MYFEKFFATWRGTLRGAYPCSDNICRSRTAIDFRAFYAGPVPMFSQAVYFMFSRTKLREWNISLKVRVMSADSQLFSKVSACDYIAVRSILAAHEASPNELDAVRFMTALHVSEQ